MSSSSMKVLLPDNSQLELPEGASGLDGFLVPTARGRGLMPDAARAVARTLLDEGWTSVTVDPYAWNERAIRGWAKAGFVEVSRGHPPDDDHTAEWVLMRFVETPEPGSPEANQVPVFRS